MSGTARSATTCTSRRATACSATTSRCSPTATHDDASAASTAQLAQYFGADQKEQTDRQRRQATGSMTYFKDGLLGGSHNFKVGGEVLLETGWFGYTQVCVAATSARTSTATARPTPSTWRADRDLGRQPRRRSERQPAEHRRRSTPSTGSSPTSTRSAARRSTSVSASTTTTCSRRSRTSSRSRSRPASRFRRRPSPSALPEVELARAAPRHQLRPEGNGKTVLKANYGHLPVQPGCRCRRPGEPEPVVEEPHLRWTDPKVRDLHPGHELPAGRRRRADRQRAGGQRSSVDPNLKQP